MTVGNSKCAEDRSNGDKVDRSSRNKRRYWGGGNVQNLRLTKGRKNRGRDFRWDAEEIGEVSDTERRFSLSETVGNFGHQANSSELLTLLVETIPLTIVEECETILVDEGNLSTEEQDDPRKVEAKQEERDGANRTVDA